MTDGNIAGLARSLVAKQVQQDPQHKEETAYRALCESLPVLLRTAGLARTVSFLAAKESAECRAVLDHLRQQLQATGVYTDPKNEKLDLAAWVTSRELKAADYRRVSLLAFRAAYWHKRLAQALLRKKPESQPAARNS